ncbi:decarboxylase [Streptomyces sp. NPDC053367]|uniref:aspartate racemase/maleate isomerase family protein n=1 Tax=Streptomyces sp. NPDC053367 TaxID=3365700 RepID=UPI0037D5B5AD
MTALGFLCPGDHPKDDYPRIEQLLASDIRVDVIGTATDEDARRVEVLRRTGSVDRLTADVEALRLAGAEAVVWASTSGSFVHGWEGAHEQVRSLALAAGMPASATSFAFVHAAQEIGVRRVAVAATYPDDVAGLFAQFLRSAGLEVVSVRAAGVGSAAEAGAWDAPELFALAEQADTGEAEALLVPDTALHTAAHLPALEEALGKPVLTAGQVTVWEALRLTDRRVNAPALGALFTREPIVQV